MIIIVIEKIERNIISNNICKDLLFWIFGCFFLRVDLMFILCLL